jgi:dehydrogenase/reductase SDR family member 7B
MATDFKDQVIWITGASSGIGAGMAQVWASQGARLILSGRRVEALEEVTAVCGGDTLILPFETTDYAALPGVVEKAHAWHGRIDCLINNAGISQRSLAVETAFPVYQQIIDIDLLAPIALTQAVLPHMVAQKSGRLAFVSSVAGIVGSPMRTGYSAAKHGLIGYADALRAETAMLGLQVHVLAPGSVRTDVSRNAIISDGTRRGASDAAIENGMDPVEAAAAMIGKMAEGEREIILATGMELDITKMRRETPDLLFDRMAKVVAEGYAAKMKADDS